MLDVMEPVIEERGFSFVQYVILSWLRDGIAVNPKDICVQYRHDSGALTRVIDQLAERGLLERVRRDRDRRKVELQLTAAGREAIESLIPLVVDKLNLALADFSSAEVQEFQRLLVKLNTTLQSPAEPQPAAVGADIVRFAMHLKIWLLLSSVVFAGCVLPPKEAPHPRPLANDTVGLTGVAAEPVADGWWDSFQDPQLDRLIRLGLKDSPTLTQAQARVGDALAQAADRRKPDCCRAPTSMRARCISARRRTTSFRRRSRDTASGWARPARALGWDLDFWGRQADAVHRAQDLTQSARFDVDNARLMLGRRHRAGLRRAVSRIRARGHRRALRGAAPEHRRHHAPPRRRRARHAARIA